MNFINIESCFRRSIRFLEIYKNNYRNHSTVELSYRLYGKRSDIPIVVLHAYLASKRNWHTVCKKLNEGTNKWVIAVDARNHGDSPHTDSHTYLELAADVLHLMDKLKIEQTSLIGHSMGGRTAMTLALKEPERVQDVVIVDISPTYLRSINVTNFTGIFDIMLPIKFTTDNINEAKAETRRKLETQIDDKGLIELLIMNVGEKNGKIAWKLNINTLKAYLHDLVSFPEELKGKQFAGRALFIGGSRSKFIPPDDLPNIRTYFVNAELEYLDAGHNLHYEKHQEFVERIINFFAK